MLLLQSIADEGSIDPISRKRRRRPSLPDSPPHAGTAQHPPKKQRPTPSHPDFPPRRFWEELSEIHLTKNALRALDRFGASNPPDPALKPSVQPTGRRLSNPTNGQQLVESFLHSSPTAPSRQIRRFASHGGPDLRDLRGYRFTGPIHSMSSRQLSLGRRKRGSETPVQSSGTPITTTTTRTTGPYDRNFQQHLTNNGIYPALYTYPDGKPLPRPDNMDEIKQILGQRRRSLSPSQFSEGTFDAYQRADAFSAKESLVMSRVIPIIEGKLDDLQSAAGQIPFGNLDPLTDGSLVPGNPDIYYGARPELLRPEVYNEIGGQIIPSTQGNLPAAPNFFLHVKGPEGSLSVASRQACYDAALGARGMHSLRSYRQSEPCYDNKAYTLMSVYHGGHLKMYTSHLVPPRAPGEGPAFAMTQIKGWSMTGDADTFRQGAAAYRNGRDWAKRQRDDAIKQANERAAEAGPGASSFGDGPGLSFASEASGGETIATSQQTVLDPASNMVPPYESESSADELSLDSWEFRPSKRTKSYRPRKKT